MTELTDRQRLEKLRRIKELQAKAGGAPQEQATPQDGGMLKTIDDVMRSLAQGATLGFADEIAGAANSLFSATPRGELIERERARDEQISPGVAIPGQIGGAVMSAVAAPATLPLRAASAAKGVPGIIRAGLGGAAAGGVAGAGFSEGGLEERAPAAGQGAAIGGTVGLAAPIVIGLIGRFGKAAVRPILDRIGKGPQNAAVRKVLNALDNDKTTLDDAVAQMRQMGDDAALVDVGPNVGGLGEAAAGRPGQALERATDLFTSRRAGQTSRILQKFDDAIGPTGREVVERVEESPRFLAALDQNVPLDSQLLDLMRRPALKSAWNKARVLAGNEGTDIPPHAEFLKRAQAGDIAEVKTTLMHWLKKGLDDVLEGQRDTVTKRLPNTNNVQAIQNVRRQFREIVKTRNPEYGASLGRISREKTIDTAYQDGLNFLRLKSPVQVEQIMGRMDDIQKRAFQRGIRDAVENRISDAGDLGFDQSAFVLRQQRKLKAAFGDKADDLIAGTKAERTMATNENRILGGSRTAFREAQQEDFGFDPGAFGQAARDATRGDVVGATANTLRGVSQRLQSGSPAVREQVGEIVFDPSLQNLGRLQQGAVRRGTLDQGQDAIIRALIGAGGLESGRATGR